jgi:hypothetical protein
MGEGIGAVGLGSLYTLLSLILVILINAAGTSFHYSHDPTKYNTTTLSNLHILEVGAVAFHFADLAAQPLSRLHPIIVQADGCTPTMKEEPFIQHGSLDSS